MIEYIITAGFLTASVAVLQYKRHKKNMAKIKALHEKEKHYLRRDQRKRLKLAKEKAKMIREQKEIAAERAASPDIVPIIKNVIADINNKE